MFNMFEELFAPGRKHTRDEQNRLELTREDVGDGDPGRGPIDLASGKVVVRQSEQPGQPDQADQPEQPDQSDQADQPERTAPPHVT
ncbi:DUF6191 domain-containing protein [Streptomyces sp. NBC_00280]|uniref:DUF6191 domain-containing protein n=1 Tax=Streptomyces sp. NBC_00280 TaxID=2975699 RepID=UPI00324CA77C